MANTLTIDFSAAHPSGDLIENANLEHPASALILYERAAQHLENGQALSPRMDRFIGGVLRDLVASIDLEDNTEVLSRKAARALKLRIHRNRYETELLHRKLAEIAFRFEVRRRNKRRPRLRREKLAERAIRWLLLNDPGVLEQLKRQARHYDTTQPSTWLRHMSVTLKALRQYLPHLLEEREHYRDLYASLDSQNLDLDPLP